MAVRISSNHSRGGLPRRHWHWRYRRSRGRGGAHIAKPDPL